MYEELVAKRLAFLRTAKGVSAREMSLDIGQNASYINRIEMVDLCLLCKGLSISASTLA